MAVTRSSFPTAVHGREAISADAARRSAAASVTTIRPRLSSSMPSSTKRRSTWFTDGRVPPTSSASSSWVSGIITGFAAGEESPPKVTVRAASRRTTRRSSVSYMASSSWADSSSTRWASSRLTRASSRGLRSRRSWKTDAGMLSVRTGSRATTLAVRRLCSWVSRETSPKWESGPRMLTIAVSPEGRVTRTATRPSSTMWKVSDLSPSLTRLSRRA